MNRTRVKARHGFTVIELILVIVVIAILAVITVISYVNIQSRADLSRLQQDVYNSRTALTMYSVDNDGEFPEEGVVAGLLHLSANSTYQYTYTSSTNTYCLTISSDRHELYTTNTIATSVEGVCDGHTSRLGGTSVALPDPIVSDQLLAWWTFNNGLAHDETGTYPDGSLMNGAYATVGENGTANGAIYLDGVDDYVSLGDVLNNVPLPITVTAWVNLRDADSENPILVTDNSQAYYGNRYSVNPSLQTYQHFGNGGGASSASRRSAYSPISSVPINSWVFIVYTMTSYADMASYINGVLKSTTTYSGAATTLLSSASYGATVGYMNNSSSQQYYARMAVDDLRVYTKTLSASEVSQLYAAHAK